MDSVSPTTRTGMSGQMLHADSRSNTFWKSVGNTNAIDGQAEFARCFREPYLERVREYPQATGYGRSG